MQTSIHKLGQWTALSLIVLVLIYLVAIAGMFMSGVMPPGEPYLSVIGTATLAYVPVKVFFLGYPAQCCLP